MKNNTSKIFVNKIDKKIDNNKEVYYSYLDKSNEVEDNKIYLNEYELQQKINNLFRSNDFIYKKKLYIKTNKCEKEYIIISKSYDYLLTLSGEKIYIKDIIDIK